MNRRLLLLAPLGVAIAGGAGFYAMLARMQAGTFDPRGVPSMLMGKQAPAFALPGLDGPELSSKALASGRPVLVNFFASWCEPCVAEAPVLMALKQEGVPMYGIAYKDATPATSTYLERHGNPYDRVASDLPGRAAIDWGVTGVPETYLVDGNGIVRWRFVGPMPEDVAGIMPKLLKKFA